MALMTQDILENIGEKLKILPRDYVRSRAVCMTWRYSIPKKSWPLYLGIPHLLVPHNHQQEKDNQSEQQQRACSFFSMFDGNVCDVELPEVEGGLDNLLFRGSSHGWMIGIGKGPNIYLINPLLNNQIQQLPPITTFPKVLEYRSDIEEYRMIGTSHEIVDEEYSLRWDDIRRFYIQKVVLSSSPSPNKNYIAMAIYGDHSTLAFCKGGPDSRWIILDTDAFNYEDILFYKDKFYTVTWHGVVSAVLLSDLLAYSSSSSSTASMPRPVLEQVSTIPKGVLGCPRILYLVESSNSSDLLLVSRYCDIEEDYYRTTHFMAFTLNLDSSLNPKGVEEMESLGDSVLLLGCNESLCLPTSHDFRPSSEKGNCIYFTDDYVSAHYDYFSRHLNGKIGGADMGVFDYKSKTISLLPVYKHDPILFPPPVWWFMPNDASLS